MASWHDGSQELDSTSNPPGGGLIPPTRHDDRAPGNQAISERDEPTPSTASSLLKKQGDAYAVGSLIGRYLVIGVQGKGGMGIVYQAYDPELDRRVAIKLLHASRTTERSRKYLVREARALAQLSHPNVVQVHDAGIHDDDVFVAMELVEGTSVKQWCRSQPSSAWRTVLAAFVEAGRGLAAAHDKGLIHRDIKPSNLLRGSDGRVRVADFGLARGNVKPTDLLRRVNRAATGNGSAHRPVPSADDVSYADLASSASSDSEPLSLSGDTFSSQTSSQLQGLLDEKLTRTGRMLGTPIYMAPEQHFNQQVGVAADQYSFCVALYEGLYGRLPFARQRRPSDLVSDKLTGSFLPPPSNTRVPGWMYHALLRGMAPRPEDRYPSMRALMAVLQDDPIARRRARWRTLALAVVIVSLASVAAWGILRDPQAAAGDPCQDIEQELVGVWDEPTRSSVREAFEATGASFASDTADRVGRVLDDHAADWVAMRGEICRARHERVDTEELEVESLRHACLEQRRGQLRALTEVFVRDANRRVVSRAVQAARALSPIDYCADVQTLTARIPPPEDPELRVRVDEYRPQVARLRALYEAGNYRRGLADGQALLAELETLEFAPLEAQAMYWLARLRDGAGDYGDAESLLRRAIQRAAEGHDKLLVAQAWTSLLFVVGYRQKRFAEAENIMAWLDPVAQLADDEVTLAHALSNRAVVLRNMGQHHEAIMHYRQALEIRERVLGADHPRVAATLNNLARALMGLGRYGEAKAIYERALDVKRRSLGPDHPSVALTLHNLGGVLDSLGQYDSALSTFQRALAIREDVQGPDHPQVAGVLMSLGHTQLKMGNHARAAELFEQALAIDEPAARPRYRELRYSLTGLARALVHQGLLEEAAAVLQRAQALEQKALSAGHPRRAFALLARGEFLIARGRPGDAVPVLESALALDKVTLRPHIKLALARALWRADIDRDRVRTLVEQTRQYYHSLGHQPGLAITASLLDDYRDAGPSR